ncbi:hypothetical protein HZH68_006342 [Vespula germanica]|uniref:Uncharacterized protein n=3 Tax=Vespula TaxID=7451 RepID=A0A834NDK9_VESGE|nr:hypothetical protein HZH68_006342 [Vespula germanica]KAF7427365.1 hypothetical protein H0235_007059 [Vespula pensylvanica]
MRPRGYSGDRSELGAQTQRDFLCKFGKWRRQIISPALGMRREEVYWTKWREALEEQEEGESHRDTVSFLRDHRVGSTGTPMNGAETTMGAQEVYSSDLPIVLGLSSGMRLSRFVGAGSDLVDLSFYREKPPQQPTREIAICSQIGNSLRSVKPRGRSVTLPTRRYS